MEKGAKTYRGFRRFEGVHERHVPRLYASKTSSIFCDAGCVCLG